MPVVSGATAAAAASAAAVAAANAARNGQPAEPPPLWVSIPLALACALVLLAFLIMTIMACVELWRSYRK